MADVAPDFGDGPPPQRYPNVKPSHAASMIVADISGNQPRFLMGQRSNAHVFMPGFLVFPGGRLERRELIDCPVQPEDGQLIAKQANRKRLAKALLGCALRETMEETGLDLTSNKAPMRYIGRAITPPGQVRRYDTRFFLTTVEKAGHQAISPVDNELVAVDWFEQTQIPTDRLHRITKLVLEAALARLSVDPMLSMQVKTPTHRFRHGKAVVEWE